MRFEGEALSKIFDNTFIYSPREKNRRRKGGVRGVMKEICEESGIRETELRGGGRRRKISGVREESLFLRRDMGIPMAEIVRQLEVGTLTIGTLCKGKREN